MSWNDTPKREHSKAEWAIVITLIILAIALAVSLAGTDDAGAQALPTMIATNWEATSTSAPVAPSVLPTITLLPWPPVTPTPPAKGCAEKVGGMCTLFVPLIYR